jgi:hypothetical protein
MNPPEIELCLLVSRAQLSPQAWERALELLSTPLRWEFLLERAKAFGLFPLVYTALSTHGFPGVPDAVRAEWASIFRLHVIRTELLAMELAQILRLLSNAKISAMPLKGIPLAESLYGDAALRVSDDIDLLVPLGSAIEAFRILVSSGYQSEFASQPRLLELNVRYGKDCLLIRKEPAYTVGLELHSALVWGGSLDRGLLEQVWAEAPRITFRGVPAFALSAEWEFLYLAIVAGRHGGSSLKWYTDLDRLCRRRSIDWEKACEKAMSLGWAAAVRSTLEVCRSWFETPFGPAFGSTPPEPRVGVPRPSDLPSPSSNLFLFGLLDTPTRKLRYLAIRLFIPTLADCEFLPLPQSLFFLYYPLRPFRVIVKVGGWFLAAGIKRLSRLFRDVHLW